MKLSTCAKIDRQVLLNFHFRYDKRKKFLRGNLNHLGMCKDISQVKESDTGQSLRTAPASATFPAPLSPLSMAPRADFTRPWASDARESCEPAWLLAEPDPASEGNMMSFGRARGRLNIPPGLDPSFESKFKDLGR